MKSNCLGEEPCFKNVRDRQSAIAIISIKGFRCTYVDAVDSGIIILLRKLVVMDSLHDIKTIKAAFEMQIQRHER